MAVTFRCLDAAGGARVASRAW